MPITFLSVTELRRSGEQESAVLLGTFPPIRCLTLALDAVPSHRRLGFQDDGLKAKSADWVSSLSLLAALSAARTGIIELAASQASSKVSLVQK